MTRILPTVQKTGTLYVQVRKPVGVDDGCGTNSTAAKIRDYLLNTYSEIKIGQTIQ
jgi:hypothetical protein